MDNELFMSLLELSWPSVLSNQCVQIDIHMLENEIDVFIVSGWDYLFEADDVRVFKLS